MRQFHFTKCKHIRIYIYNILSYVEQFIYGVCGFAIDLENININSLFEYKFKRILSVYKNTIRKYYKNTFRKFNNLLPTYS